MKRFLLLTLLMYVSISHADPLPGMPVVHDIKNIYADAAANMFAAITHNALHRVYVPNSLDNTVSVIDSTTYQVINTLKVGHTPQHIVPAYNLQTLWVLNNRSNSLTPIDNNIFYLHQIAGVKKWCIINV